MQLQIRKKNLSVIINVLIDKQPVYVGQYMLLTKKYIYIYIYGKHKNIKEKRKKNLNKLNHYGEIVA